jgi:hypothetical protein
MAVINSLHSDLEDKYLFITFICYIILEIQASAFCFFITRAALFLEDDYDKIYKNYKGVLPAKR